MLEKASPVNISRLPSGLSIVGSVQYRIDGQVVALVHGFDWKCHCGRTQPIRVMVDSNSSDAHVEDMLSAALERTLMAENEYHQMVSSKLPENTASWDKALTLDVARELKLWRNWAKKRKASSTGKTLFKGIN